MKRISLILLFGVSLLSCIAQVKNQMNGTLQIQSYQQLSADTFEIAGYFNDLSGNYSMTQIDSADQIWDGGCQIWEIKEVTQLFPVLVLKVTRQDTALTYPSLGLSVCFRPTATYKYPLVTVGLPEKLERCIENHQVILFDELSLIGGGGASHWDSIVGKPPGFADNIDNVNDADSDPNNEIETWSTLAGIPAGFADNVDNVIDNDWTVSGSIMYSAVPGNVGIGLSGPQTPLHLLGTFRFDGGGSGYMDLKNTLGEFQFEVSDGFDNSTLLGMTPTGEMVLYLPNSATKNYLVNTGSGYAEWGDISWNDLTDVPAGFADNTDDGGFWTYLTDGIYYTEQIRNTSSGTASIGNYALDIQGGFQLRTDQNATSLSIGEQALNNLSGSGTENVAIGRYAGINVTNQDMNTFVGTYAGHAATYPDQFAGDNTMIGSEAGQSVHSEGDNTFLGVQAGSTSQTDTLDGSIAIGVGAMRSSTMRNSIAIGNGAAQNKTLDGIFIGTGTGGNSSNQFDSVIVIGNDAEPEMDREIILDFEGRSQQLRSGHYRWDIDQDTTGHTGHVMTLAADGQLRLAEASGSGADADWTISGNDMHSAVSGNVGIGVSSPARKLHISTVGESTGGVVRLESDDTYDAKFEFWENGAETWEMGVDESESDLFKIASPDFGANQFNLTKGGRLGLGIGSPSESIHVKTQSSAVLLLEADSDNVNEADVARIEFSQDGGSVTALVGFGSNVNDFRVGNLHANGQLELYSGGAREMVIDIEGKVGIGTDNPSSTLNVVNNGASGVVNQSTGAAGKVMTTRTDGVWIGLVSGGNTPTLLFENGEDFAISEANADDTPYDATYSSLNQRVKVVAGGNVAIGSHTPSTKLDVDGQIRMRGGSPSLGSYMTSDASGVASWDQRQISATKSADESITSDATLNTDADFTCALEANTTYRFEAYMRSNSVATQIEMDFAVPSGASLYFKSNNTGAELSDAFSFDISGGADLADVLRGVLVVGATAGDLTLSWAQTSSSGTASTLKKDSYILLTKI